MSFSLVPDRLYAAYTDITPQMLQSWGIRLLLCDLDYTLAPRSVARPDEQVLAWVQDMKAAGIEVMILSNNRSSARVETFCKDMGITYVGHAGKPAKRGYREAMAKVPKDASVTAGTHYVAPLAQREVIYSLRHTTLENRVGNS